MISNLLRKVIGTEYTALDFGHHGLKAVKCRVKGSKISLEKVAWTELDSTAMLQRELRDPSVMAESLKELFGTSGIKPRNLIFAPSSSQIVVRTLEMPIMDGKDLKEALLWEAEEFLPYSADEIVFDYQVLGREKGTQRVLLVVMGSVVFDQYLQSLKLSDLRPQVANAAELALVSLLEYQGLLDDTVLILDIGLSEGRIIIADQNHLYLSRSAETGEDNYTQELFSHEPGYFKGDEKKSGLQFEEDYEEMETSESDILNHPSEPEEPAGEEIDLNILADKMAQEIIRSLAYLQERHKGKKVKRVYITGGTALFSGFCELLSSKIEEEVEMLSPLAGIEVKNEFEIEEPGIYNVALGLVASEVLYNEN